jgi:hypothetical protein
MFSLVSINYNSVSTVVDRGSILSRGRDFCSSPLRPDPLWNLPSLLLNGYRRVLSHGLKRPGCEGNESPPTSADVLMMWYLVKHRIRLHGVVLNEVEEQIYFYVTQMELHPFSTKTVHTESNYIYICES